MATQLKPQNKSVFAGGNLLQIKAIDNLMRSKWFPGIIQWPTLLIFMVIMFQLLLGPESAHDNFGTALTWVLVVAAHPDHLFVPGTFLVCHLSVRDDQRSGPEICWQQPPGPAFPEKIWHLDHRCFLHHDHLERSCLGCGGKSVWLRILMLTLTTGVIASGSFFERRTFCRHICFLGGLSGNYARTGMLALRGTPEICATCTAASCYKGTDKAPGCPLFEFPKNMTSNANCVICADCIKNCPNDSIQLTMRPPTKELWFIRKPKMEEAFLSAVIMGIVFVQNVTMLEVWGWHAEVA